MFHVYGVKASYKGGNVVENFEQWVEFMYVDSNIGKVKSLIGKVHEYLYIPLDYTKKGEVKIDMRKYVKK